MRFLYILLDIAVERLIYERMQKVTTTIDIFSVLLLLLSVNQNL